MKKPNKTMVDATCPRCIQWDLYQKGDQLQYLGSETTKKETKHFYKCPKGHRIELWEIPLKEIMRKNLEGRLEE